MTRDAKCDEPCMLHMGTSCDDDCMKPCWQIGRGPVCTPCYPRGRGRGPVCQTNVFVFGHLAVVYRQCFGIVQVVDELECGRCIIMTGPEFRRVRPCVSGRASLHEVPR